MAPTDLRNIHTTGNSCRDALQSGLPAISYHLNPGFPGQFSPIFQVYRHHFQVVLIQFKNLRIIKMVDNVTTSPVSSTLFLFIQMKVQILNPNIFLLHKLPLVVKCPRPWHFIARGGPSDYFLYILDLCLYTINI